MAITAARASPPSKIQGNRVNGRTPSSVATEHTQRQQPAGGGIVVDMHVLSPEFRGHGRIFAFCALLALALRIYDGGDHSVGQLVSGLKPRLRDASLSVYSQSDLLPQKQVIKTKIQCDNGSHKAGRRARGPVGFIKTS